MLVGSGLLLILAPADGSGRLLAERLESQGCDCWDRFELQSIHRQLEAGQVPTPDAPTGGWTLLEESGLTRHLPFWLQTFPEARVVLLAGDAPAGFWSVLGQLDTRPVAVLHGRGDIHELAHLRSYLADPERGVRPLETVRRALLPPPTAPNWRAKLLDVSRREGKQGLVLRLLLKGAGVVRRWRDQSPPPLQDRLRVLWLAESPVVGPDFLRQRGCQLDTPIWRGWRGLAELARICTYRPDTYDRVVLSAELSSQLGPLLRKAFPHARLVGLAGDDLPHPALFDVIVTANRAQRSRWSGQRVAVLDDPGYNQHRLACALALPLDAPVVSLPGASEPLVSICIPTYNGETHLGAALAGVLEQNYGNLEVVLSDDGSQDGTLDLARRMLDGSRVAYRLVEGPRRGMVANWQHSVAESRGELIKFLFQDDLLAPDCVRGLVAAMQLDERVSLSFSPRTLILEKSARKDQVSLQSAHYAGDVHLAWSDLRGLQPGKDLLADPALLDGPLNKVGEPTTVLIRRSSLDAVGPFDAEMGQVVDLDMWWRLLAQGQVAFVEKPLSVFRVHLSQVTRSNHLAGVAEDHSLKLLRKLRDSSLRPLLHPRAQARLEFLLK
ncbi:hypothetical protein ABS71_12085 [bacterium SCN 62-11]|nr:glycosyltransferase family 2 protein [Candidatus Eremiobacteraeota bacterium]ODT65629.1 MAG: hypothetical protein ABS71_12085 [bacterium SCN 62-11]